MPRPADAEGGCPPPGGGGERVLVLVKRFIGDAVLTIPFLRNLRRALPTAEIHVSGTGAARVVLAGCPYVDAFLARQRATGRGRAWGKLGDFATEVRCLARARYGRAYLVRSATSAGLAARLAGIPRRVGFRGGINPLLLSLAVPQTRGRHQADLLLDLLRADGFATDDGHNENWTDPAAADRAAEILRGLPPGRRVVFLAPCASNPRRDWPAERWVAIIGWLVGRRDCEIVLAGGRRDAAMHGAIQRGAGAALAAHVHDLSAALSLPEVSALISRCDLCAGVDTGLPHLATSHGVPTVRLFGPSDSLRWGIWRGTGAVVRPPTPSGRGPMTGIDEAAVREALARTLDALPGRG